LLATDARVTYPGPIAVDSTTGDLYVAHRPNPFQTYSVIRKVDALTGRISTIAGPGVANVRGDGGPALQANFALTGIRGLAVSPDGAYLYLSDNANTVRRIDLLNPPYNISHFAGNPAGTAATSSVNGLANITAISTPTSIDFGPDGSVFFWESYGIRRVFPNGSMITVAGCGALCTATGDNVVATTANLARWDSSAGVYSTFFGLVYYGSFAVHPSGESLYIADTTSGRIRIVNLMTNRISTILNNSVLDFRAVNPQYANIDASRTLLFGESGGGAARALNLTSSRQRILAGTGSASATVTDGNIATSTAFSKPAAAAADADGNVFISDPGSGSIRMVNITTNRVRTVAYRTTSVAPCNSLITLGSSCDYDLWAKDDAGIPVPGRNTSTVPNGLRFDATGRVLYFADPLYNRVRSFNTRTETVSTVAGVGGNGVSCGDGGPYSLAGFGGIGTTAPVPNVYTGTVGGIAVTSKGDVYLSDTAAGRIRFINMTTGIITTALGLGLGNVGAVGVPGNVIPLFQPTVLAVDPFDNLYILESGSSSRIRKWDPVANNLTTVWGGSGSSYSHPSAPTWVPLTFTAGTTGNNPGFFLKQMAVNALGHICAAESSAMVRCMIDGRVHRVAGLSSLVSSSQLISGSVATDMGLGDVQGVAFTPDGTGLFISAGGGLRYLDFSTAIGGNYSLASMSTVWGAAASATTLAQPTLTATDFLSEGTRANGTAFRHGGVLLLNSTSGDLFVTQTPPGNLAIVGVSVLIKSVRAGNGSTVELLMGGAASCSNFTATAGLPARSFRMPATPTAMALLPDGSLLFADPSKPVVWRLTSTAMGDGGGTVEQFAGAGSTNGCDGGLATRAGLQSPSGVAVDGAGNIYIAETFFSRVRRVDAATGLISTVAGSVPPFQATSGATAILSGFGGDGGPALDARLAFPTDVAVDSAGSKLFIADKGNNRVRLVDLTATPPTISTFAGAASVSAVLPSDLRANQVFLQGPHGLAWDNSTRTLYVVEAGGGRIRALPFGL
jgi:sugar lactone lactonase YvrE